MFEEIFVSKILSLPRDAATLVRSEATPKEAGPELDLYLIFDRVSYEVCWTELVKGTISKRKIKLSNIDPVMQIISIHNVRVGHHCLLIVVSKLPEKEDDRSHGILFDHYQKPYHMYTYLIELEEEIFVDGEGERVVAQELRLAPVQTFPTDYRPLSISLDYYTDTPFLFINGSNNSMHAYEIDVQTLKLHRGPHRDTLRMYWETRLRFNRDKGANVSSNISMPLCLLIERAPPAAMKKGVPGLETTAVLGYSSGLLSWTSTSRSHGVSSAPFGRVLLMDSAIMCLAFISRLRGTITALSLYRDDEECGRNEGGDHDGGDGNERATRRGHSTHVVVGLAEGAAILSLESVQVEATVLPSARNHGFVRAIAVGDVTGDGFEDFVLGFEDGTVICYSREISAEEQEAEGEGGERGGGGIHRQGSPVVATEGTEEEEVVEAEEDEDKGAGGAGTDSTGTRGDEEGDPRNSAIHDNNDFLGSRDHTDIPIGGGEGGGRPEGHNQGETALNRSLDLSRDVLDASFELYDMGEGDEEEDEDEEEEEVEEEGGGDGEIINDGEGGLGEGEVAPDKGNVHPGSHGESSSEASLATPTQIWRPYHGKLAFREEWRTWLPFPIRGLAFSNHLQIPMLPSNLHDEGIKRAASRKGPKNLSVVTTKTLHCFSLKGE